MPTIKPTQDQTKNDKNDWEGIVLNVGIWTFFTIILTFAAIKTMNRIKEQKDICKHCQINKE